MLRRCVYLPLSATALLRAICVPSTDVYSLAPQAYLLRALAIKLTIRNSPTNCCRSRAICLGLVLSLSFVVIYTCVWISTSRPRRDSFGVSRWMCTLLNRVCVHMRMCVCVHVCVCTHIVWWPMALSYEGVIAYSPRVTESRPLSTSSVSVANHLLR